MRKILLLTTMLTLTALASFAQNRAALIGLTKVKTNITYLKNESGWNPVCYLEEGKGYNDSLAFSMLKAKVDSLAGVFGYTMIPEDSVINAEAYKARSEAHAKILRNSYTTSSVPEIQAKGYGHIGQNGLGGINYKSDYFTIPSKPDVVIEALYDFDVNYALSAKGEKVMTVTAYIYIAGHSDKKRIFNLKTYYRDATRVSFVFNPKSCWGHDLAEDITSLQMDVFKKALVQLDEKITAAEEDISKHAEKQAKKDTKKK